MDDLIGTLVIKTEVALPLGTRNNEVVRCVRFKRVTLATFHGITREDASERFNEFMQLNGDYHPRLMDAEWICHCRVARIWGLRPPFYFARVALFGVARALDARSQCRATG